jgi:hypothetical protein
LKLAFKRRQHVLLATLKNTAAYKQPRFGGRQLFERRQVAPTPWHTTQEGFVGQELLCEVGFIQMLFRELSKDNQTAARMAARNCRDNPKTCVLSGAGGLEAVSFCEFRWEFNCYIMNVGTSMCGTCMMALLRFPRTSNYNIRVQYF